MFALIFLAAASIFFKTKLEKYLKFGFFKLLKKLLFFKMRKNLKRKNSTKSKELDSSNSSILHGITLDTIIKNIVKAKNYL